MAAHFIRPKINFKEKEIRVIELQPGARDDPIVANFLVTSLKDAIPYEPLSYTWGNPSVTKAIEIDKQPYSVTINLYAALLNLRKPTASRVIWVDAICINQQDNEEKSQQVNAMGNIYAGANTCLVWLGDFVDEGISVREAEAGVEIIRMIVDCKARELEVPSHRVVKGIESIVNSEWWQRLWTVQEIVLPSRAIVVWGSLSIPWETMLAAADALVTGSYYLPNDPGLNQVFGGIRFTAPILAIKFLREFWRDQRSMTPISLFWRIGDRRSTDPRDKVYALAGLFSKLFPIETDYSLTTVQVYRKAMIGMIKATGSLECWIGWRGQVGQTKGLPSWAIDWIEPAERSAQVQRFWDHCWRYHNCRADDGRRLKMSVNEEGATLSLGGVLVDTVKIVGTATSQPPDISWTLRISPKPIQRSIRGWYELAKSYFDRQETLHNRATPWQELFWRAVSGDEITRHGPGQAYDFRWVTPQDAQIFEDFRKSEDPSDTSEVYVTLNMNAIEQCFFITEKGRMGTGPPTMKAGDEVWVLCGGNVPFMLRPRESTNFESDTIAPLATIERVSCHQLLGDGFVYGIMHGEAMRAHDGDLMKVDLV